VFGQLENIADLVDYKAYRTLARSQDQVHGYRIGRARWEPETPAHINRRDDVTAQIDQAFDNFWSQGNWRDFLVPKQFLYASHFDAEKQVADVKRGVALSEVGSAGFCRI
jgi:hypothetical protein